MTKVDEHPIIEQIDMLLLEYVGDSLSESQFNKFRQNFYELLVHKLTSNNLHKFTHEEVNKLSTSLANLKEEDSFEEPVQQLFANLKRKNIAQEVASILNDLAID